MPLFGPNIAAMKAKRDLAGLLMVLKAKDRRVRGEAAKALGELRARSAVPAIAELLLSENNSHWEKLPAAEALGSIEDETAVDALVEAAAKSRARERASVEAAIGAPDAQHSVNFYVNRIAADEFALRSAIAMALGRIDGERGVRVLCDMLAAESGPMKESVKHDIRTAIADAAGRNGARLVPIFAQELKNESIEAREWAAHCLGDVGGAQAVSALVPLALDEDESFQVREAALVSLANMGDRRAIPDLEDLQNSANRVIARDAQAALDSIRQRHPLPRKDD